MEIFSALLALCVRSSPVTGEFPSQNAPHKGQWRGALKLYLICVWTNGCVHNIYAGDLRRHRTHHDVTAMFPRFSYSIHVNKQYGKDWVYLKCIYVDYAQWLLPYVLWNWLKANSFSQSQHTFGHQQISSILMKCHCWRRPTNRTALDCR